MQLTVCLINIQLFMVSFHNSGIRAWVCLHQLAHQNSWLAYMICLPLVKAEMELSFLVWTTLICIIKHHTLYHLWLPNWLNWLWNLPQTFLDSSWIKLKRIKCVEEENIMAIQFPIYREKVHFQSFFNVENLVAYPSLVFYSIYIVQIHCNFNKY